MSAVIPSTRMMLAPTTADRFARKALPNFHQAPVRGETRRGPESTAVPSAVSQIWSVAVIIAQLLLGTRGALAVLASRRRRFQVRPLVMVNSGIGHGVEHVREQTREDHAHAQ